MDTLLITGGAGFIGCNLVRRLRRREGLRIVVVDKLTYAGRRENLDDILDGERVVLEVADIADGAAMQRIFGEYRPRGVMNLAAETHVDRSIDGPRAFLETNVTGTFELLEAARTFVREIGDADRERFRFLHVSTDEVYGSLGREGRFREDTAYDPSSPYSASKAAADHLVRAYHRTYGLPTLVTNCSNNYGPYQFPEKLIPLMILNAAEGRELPIYGDGSNVRDWIYVEDHCAGLTAVLERGRPGQTYNLGGDCERTNLETVTAICELLDRARPPADDPSLAGRVTSYRELMTFVTDRPGHDLRYAIDASKAREELGWRPETGFEEGLRRTVDWYLDNRDWCAAVRSSGYDRERLGQASG
ncbi:MAG: dTDP-glucose 4,6-dehydratase [Thermoanaerobaculia bacterium]|nr:dTDP-glucose 4,6-dehydratase [Thermoanaerobaculia bacterium]